MNCLQGRIDRDNGPVVRRARISQPKWLIGENLFLAVMLFIAAILFIAAAGFLAACGGRDPLIEPQAAATEPLSVITAAERPVAATEVMPTESASTVETATPATPQTSISQSVAQPTEPLATAPSQAMDLPGGGEYVWRPIVSGLNAPVGLTNAGDGSGRIFIIEQDGLIRILQDGVLQPAPFLDISDRAVRNGSEQGLLGLVSRSLLSMSMSVQRWIGWSVSSWPSVKHG